MCDVVACCGGDALMKLRVVVGFPAVVLVAGCFGTPPRSGAAAFPASAPRVRVQAEVAPVQTPLLPHRILVVGDSTAATLFPYLRQAGMAHGIEMFSAAVLGCGVIDGQPVLDDGRPYVDTVGDTRRCARSTEAAQRDILEAAHPDVVMWLSGWEAWPNRVLDGALARWGTITGNRAIRTHIDAAVQRLMSRGARVIFLPVAPAAYPSVRGIWNPVNDARLVQLAKLLRGYVQEHSDIASLIDLPQILCPHGTPCGDEPAPGIKPRYLDGFHFDGPDAYWLAEQLVGMLQGTTSPPPTPEVPACADASVGTRPKHTRTCN